MKNDYGDSYTFDFQPNGIEENYYNDHNPFNLKGNRNVFLCVYNDILGEPILRASEIHPTPRQIGTKEKWMAV